MACYNAKTENDGILAIPENATNNFLKSHADQLRSAQNTGHGDSFVPCAPGLVRWDDTGVAVPDPVSPLDRNLGESGELFTDR